MSLDVFSKIFELSRAGESFAVATVVRVERPISAKPGDKGIIKADGTLEGWVGGGCAQDTVIREGKKTIRDGQPRFLRLVGTGARADANMASEDEGVIEYPITCHSGGTLDIYLEPVLPRPQLILLGNSSVAVTLAGLAQVLNWQVDVVDPLATHEQFPEAASISNDPSFTLPALQPISFIVVATQGHDDEPALQAAARSGAPFVAFVASKRKYASRAEYLREHGLSEEQISRIKAPAGLDIGAVTPDEIAASILAEMIQARRRQWASHAAETAQALEAAESIVAAEAVDPICGMTVEIATARYVSEFRGQKYYFCAISCKEQFDQDPEAAIRNQLTVNSKQ